MEKYQKYITRAKELGVKEAIIIPTDSIVTAEWVRLKCQYGCGGFGGLTCPPNSPTPEQTKKIISDYKNALLVHVDDFIDLNEILVKLEKEVFFDGYYKVFIMGGGPCNLCEECSEFCTHPDKARPSMEACGIDVYATVRAHGFPIEVLKSKTDKVNFYGIVLIE